MTPPPADFDVDVDLAVRLLADQFPDLAGLSLRMAAEGWDNVVFRLGNEMALRIPRREIAAQLIEHEQRWLPELAPLLPVPIPAPLRMGVPTRYYPFRWSVVPWVEGATALAAPASGNQASLLGRFLRALHDAAVPTDPPVNPYRGVPLTQRQDLAGRLAAVAAALGDTAVAATQLLDLALAAPISEPATWLHGDLHSKNVITVDGSIVSIIDWGDICTGDPATDLAAVWILFDPADHGDFWQEYGAISEALQLRSKAWAIAFGLMLHDSHHESDPAFALAGLTTIRRAVLDP